jgi:hypothetical protein
MAVGGPAGLSFATKGESASLLTVQQYPRAYDIRIRIGD